MTTAEKVADGLTRLFEDHKLLNNNTWYSYHVYAWGYYSDKCCVPFSINYGTTPYPQPFSDRRKFGKRRLNLLKDLFDIICNDTPERRIFIRKEKVKQMYIVLKMKGYIQ